MWLLVFSPNCGRNISLKGFSNLKWAVVNLLGVSYFLHVLQDIWHVWWRIPLSPSGRFISLLPENAVLLCSNFSLCLSWNSLWWIGEDASLTVDFRQNPKCREWLWFSTASTAFWAFDKANPRCFCNHQPRTWAMTFLYYYAKFFIVSDSQKRAGVMCRDFSRNDTLSVCIRHRFERAELWWRQSFFSCNATVLGDKLSSNRRCRKTPKTLVSQVLLPLKTKGKDKNEGFVSQWF